MKKKILIGLFGVGLLLPTMAIRAEELGEDVIESSNAEVKVGKVEVPVYNVDISWNAFEFNWKYNEEKNEYEWETEKVNPYIVSLSSILETEQVNIDETYFNTHKSLFCLDQECETPINQDLEYEEMIANKDNYYYMLTSGENSNHFHIGDASTGGRIVPTIKWTSSNGYEYVEGIFEYREPVYECKLVESEELFNSKINQGIKLYDSSDCKNEIHSSTEYKTGIYEILEYTTLKTLKDGEIPDTARRVVNNTAWYDLTIKLENKEKPTETPKKGDTIGIITITIKVK